MSKSPAELLSSVVDVMPAADAAAFLKDLVAYHREKLVVEKDIARIEAQRDVLLAAIHAKYGLLERVFDRLFEERGSAIDECFLVIREGLDRGSDERVTVGLRSLAHIVSASPFADVDKLMSIVDSGGKVEI